MPIWGVMMKIILVWDWLFAGFSAGNMADS